MADATSLVAAPDSAWHGAVAAGTKKAALPPMKIFILGVLSGIHIGFGSFLVLIVGAACPELKQSNPGLQKMVMGAFGLPFGVLMTVISGAELFTGNTFLITAAVLAGRTTPARLLKSWVISYAGNAVGSLLLVGLVIGTGELRTNSAAASIAAAKTSHTFFESFCRGVMCNILVCMAVYLASTARDLTGKAVAIWFPVSAFVAMGMDHCIANLFLVPLGILMPSAAVPPTSWSTFLLGSQLPVTLGNIVGGAGCVGLPYWLAFGGYDDDGRPARGGGRLSSDVYEMQPISSMKG